jgi:hypothetical protein
MATGPQGLYELGKVLRFGPTDPTDVRRGQIPLREARRSIQLTESQQPEHGPDAFLAVPAVQRVLGNLPPEADLEYLQDALPFS